jgi:DNA-directed RNA polymerase I subunit RPA1
LARLVGEECAAKGVGLEGAYTAAELLHELEECHRSSAELPRLRAELDRGYKAALNPATNAINTCCLPKGLIKQFPNNNLQLMVNSGAKVLKILLLNLRIR